MSNIALICLIFAIIMIVGFGLWMVWLHFQ